MNFRKFHSDHPATISLVEEVLRSELNNFYGQNVHIFCSKIVGENIVATYMNQVTITDEELATDQSLDEGPFEREVRFTIIAGPFEQKVPLNPLEKRPRNFRRIKAKSRVYSLSRRAHNWKVHYLEIAIQHASGYEVFTKIYRPGRIEGTKVVSVDIHPCPEIEYSGYIGFMLS